MKRLELPKQKFSNMIITPLITIWENTWEDDMHIFPFNNMIRYNTLLQYKVLFINQLGFKNNSNG